MNEQQAERMIELLEEISNKLDSTNSSLYNIEPSYQANDLDAIAQKIDSLIEVSTGIKDAVEQGF